MLNKVTSIRYSKLVEDELDIKRYELTERTIVPTEVPGNIRGLDVTDLSVKERQEIADYSAGYAQYIDDHLKTAFSFEDWLSHSKGIDFSPKWRTFKPEQTEIL